MVLQCIRSSVTILSFTASFEMLQNPNLSSHNSFTDGVKEKGDRGKQLRKSQLSLNDRWAGNGSNCSCL